MLVTGDTYRKPRRDSNICFVRSFSSEKRPSVGVVSTGKGHQVPSIAERVPLRYVGDTAGTIAARCQLANRIIIITPGMQIIMSTTHTVDETEGACFTSIFRNTPTRSMLRQGCTKYFLRFSLSRGALYSPPPKKNKKNSP